MHPRLKYFGGLIALLLVWASVAQADGPPIALVVESDLDALKLRAAVAERLDREVTSLSRAQATLSGPQVVLTVSIDRSVGVSVMYWDRETAAWLSAPLPQTTAATHDVAAALAAALVRQHDRSTEQARFRPGANPYLLPKAPARVRPAVSPVNPYYQRARRYTRVRGS